MKNGLKFGSRQLFYATALIASGLALGPQTLLISLIVLVGWTVVFLQSNRRQALVWLLLCGLILGCLAGLMLPAAQQVREAARRVHCQNNMRQIMLAILNYEMAYGRCPTDLVVTSSQGVELRHSWRVQILPFIEQQALYDQYDFDEPWDGPNNRKLQSVHVDVFTCPANDTGSKTPYKLVVGPGTAFEVGQAIKFGDVPDGTANTVALVEDTANPVSWLEPTDLTVDQAVQLLNGTNKNRCAHAWESAFERRSIGLNLGLLDGSVWCWPPDPTKPILPGEFLIGDGVFFDLENRGKEMVEIKYGGYIALTTYMLLILLPLFYLKRNTEPDPDV